MTPRDSAIDAAGLSTRQINTKLRQVADRNGEVTLLNPQARHNLAVGIMKPCRVTFEGSVGYYCCSFCDGPDFAIKGNAGWGLGSNLMRGSIKLTQNAGSSVASSMRGGEVFVGGNAGARAGISMKGGLLIIRGNTGYMTGFIMQRGVIIVCGDVGEATADSMYEGVVFVGGKIGSLGSDTKAEQTTTEDEDLIYSALKKHGIDDSFEFKKIVSARRLWHYDELEPLEKERLVI
jgi:glutamate synthase domain-containing protein 3